MKSQPGNFLALEVRCLFGASESAFSGLNRDQVAPCPRTLKIVFLPAFVDLFFLQKSIEAAFRRKTAAVTRVHDFSVFLP